MTADSSPTQSAPASGAPYRHSPGCVSTQPGMTYRSGRQVQTMRPQTSEAIKLIQDHIYSACEDAAHPLTMDDALAAHPRLVIDPIDGISLIDDRDVTKRGKGYVCVTYLGKPRRCIDTGVHWLDSTYLIPFMRDWFSEYQTVPGRDTLAKNFVDALVLPMRLRSKTALFFRSR